MSQATSRVEGTANLMSDNAKKEYIALLDMLSTEETDGDDRSAPKKKEAPQKESDDEQIVELKKEESSDAYEVKVVLKESDADRMRAEIDEQAAQ